MRSVTQKHTNTCMHGLINSDSGEADRSGVCEGVILLQTSRRGRLGHLRHRRILRDREDHYGFEGVKTTTTKSKAYSLLLTNL